MITKTLIVDLPPLELSRAQETALRTMLARQLEQLDRQMILGPVAPIVYGDARAGKAFTIESLVTTAPGCGCRGVLHWPGCRFDGVTS